MSTSNKKVKSSKDYYVPWGVPPDKSVCKECNSEFLYNSKQNKIAPPYCKEHDSPSKRNKEKVIYHQGDVVTGMCLWHGGHHEFSYVYQGGQVSKFCREHNVNFKQPIYNTGYIYTLTCKTCGVNFTHRYIGGSMTTRCDKHRRQKSKPVYKKPGPMSQDEVAYYEEIKESLESTKSTFDVVHPLRRTQGGVAIRAKLKNN